MDKQVEFPESFYFFKIPACNIRLIGRALSKKYLFTQIESMIISVTSLTEWEMLTGEGRQGLLGP